MGNKNPFEIKVRDFHIRDRDDWDEVFDPEEVPEYLDCDSDDENEGILHDDEC